MRFPGKRKIINKMSFILQYILFPGFLFTAIIGLLVSWIDRKVTARVQWRVGPPLLQPFYDMIKLMFKEILIPRGCSKFTFLAAPVLGIASITMVSTIIWSVMLWPSNSFSGDIIVILYFLMIPSVGVILGGFSSGNPVASLGASREMKLMLADELPFLLAILVPIIQSGNTIRLSEILNYQETYGMVFMSLSGVIAMIVAVICMQAKLTLVPFDLPEAETEIMGGVFVEYSGPPLAMFKLSRMMMLFTLPMTLIVLFLGGMHFHGWQIVTSLLKYVVLLVLIILIRNTNPRVRMDQAFRFFWGPMTLLGIIAVILAILGL